VSATYDDLLNAPENLVAELIDGELYLSRRPPSPHARASSVLLCILAYAFDDVDAGPGVWWIVREPELHLGGHALVPDTAGWRRAHVAEFPDTSGCEIAPDWLCEILSGTTARVDRVKKLPIYANHGVRHVWLLDPVLRTLEVLQLEASRWIVAGNYGGGDKVRAEPFDAVEIDLAALWLPS